MNEALIFLFVATQKFSGAPFPHPYWGGAGHHTTARISHQQETVAVSSSCPHTRDMLALYIRKLV